MILMRNKPRLSNSDTSCFFLISKLCSEDLKLNQQAMDMLNDMSEIMKEEKCINGLRIYFLVCCIKEPWLYIVSGLCGN